jgi:murein DD-endopeptidase MepM/ murein hydrolase activator NlpD
MISLYRFVSEPVYFGRAMVWKTFVSGLLFVFLFGCRGGPSGDVQETLSQEDPTYRHWVRKGDTFYEILVEQGLEHEVVIQLSRALKDVDFKYLIPGDSLVLCYDTLGNLSELRVQRDVIHGYVVRPCSLGFVACRDSVVLRRDLFRIQGEIRSSLYETLLEKGEHPELVSMFADIFAWDIDFYAETRHGDEFSILVEKRYRGDRFIDYGRMICGYYNGSYVGEKWALYYEDGDGRKDYYDVQGNSLRRAFLKSPLSYSRISSHFSHRRFHPILRIYRPHHGVDYAAPTGTPISSIGEGTVTFAGWKSGYGRYVRIRHRNGYESGYGHLSRIRVKSGAFVKQGQLIGNVGMTGLATGPHLHFEIRKDGRFVNPLRVYVPPADPLKEEFKPDFYAEVSGLRIHLIDVP